MKDKEEVFELEDLEVEEISIVNEPAVPDAKIMIVKSEDSCEEDEEDEKPKKSYINAKDIIAAIEAMMDSEKDNKKKQRYKLVIANLRSLWGIKKENGDGDVDEDDIQKAGKTISRSTATTLQSIAAQLLQLSKELAKLSGVTESKDDKDYDYGTEEYQEKQTNYDDQFLSAVSEAIDLLVNGKLQKNQFDELESVMNYLISYWEA